MVWNRPFKAKYQELYNIWMLNGDRMEWTANRNPRAPAIGVYLEWICMAWIAIPAMVRNIWKIDLFEKQVSEDACKEASAFCKICRVAKVTKHKFKLSKRSYKSLISNLEDVKTTLSSLSQEDPIEIKQCLTKCRKIAGHLCYSNLAKDRLREIQTDMKIEMHRIKQTFLQDGIQRWKWWSVFCNKSVQLKS
uniref:Uncharacterized protein n=1 Tax=Ditylenchus dipsaci TaxID=166011 RepID=A0A915DH72_9BILA